MTGETTRPTVAARLVIAWVLGTAVGVIAGLVVGVRFQLPWASLVAAALSPVLALVLMGFHSRGQLVKIAVYALLGWTLSFLLLPATSESRAKRAQRPAITTGACVTCHLISGLLTFVGFAFMLTPSASRPHQGPVPHDG